jgi:hypothetical protein
MRKMFLTYDSESCGEFEDILMAVQNDTGQLL